MDRNQNKKICVFVENNEIRRGFGIRNSSNGWAVSVKNKAFLTEIYLESCHPSNFLTPHLMRGPDTAARPRIFEQAAQVRLFLFPRYGLI